MNLSKSDVLVIIPAFNEELSIADVVTELIKESYVVLVVDDGSSDRTAEISRSCGASVLQLPYNLGVGGALRAGFRVAQSRGFPAVIQVDADGQHPIQSIVDLITEMNKSDADLVLGSRFLATNTTMNVSSGRRKIMNLLARSASRATRTSITDSTSGFRLIRQPLLRELSEVLPCNYLGDTYEALIIAGRAGYKIREIAAPMASRSHGQSSASITVAVRTTIKSLLIMFLRIQPKIRESNAMYDSENESRNL
jgi:glycosyltransferase involved in cell wall biosynthesis